MDVPSRPGPGLPQTSLPKIDVTSPRDPAAAISNKAKDALGSVPPGSACQPKDGFERPLDLRKAQSLFGGGGMSLELAPPGGSSEARRSDRGEGTTIDGGGLTVKGDRLAVGPVSRLDANGLALGIVATNEMSDGERETHFTGVQADERGVFLGSRTDLKNYGHLEGGIALGADGLTVGAAKIRSTGQGPGAAEVQQTSIHLSPGEAEVRSDTRIVEDGRTTQEKHESAGTNGLGLNQVNHEEGETRSGSFEPDGVRFRDSRGEKGQAAVNRAADKAGDVARDLLGQMNG